METRSLRVLIQDKLQSGRLPYHSASKVFGGPADGEICAACGARVAKGQLVVQGVTKQGGADDPLSLHVICFALWNEERRRRNAPHTRPTRWAQGGLTSQKVDAKALDYG
jgi:hypothetical protein